jgi:hypothetical protein
VRWRLIVSHTLSRWQAVLLGIVVLLGTGLAVVGLFAVGSRQWFRGSTFHVRCGFRSIQGIDAGEVVAIVPPGAPRGDVILRLRLDSTLHSLVRTDATVQIVSEGLIGGKAIEINPGTESAGPAPEDGLLSSRSTAELSEVLDQVKSTLQKVRDGAGPLGLELSATMQQARATMHSFEKSGDAVRKLPIVRSYAQDTLALLVRPECKRDRTVFAETDLFEPGRATLTVPGRQRLDELVPRIKSSLQHSGSSLVVAACADPKTTPNSAVARTVTESQSAAVCAYLKDHYAIQKAGWVSWREVVPVGLGTDGYPGEETKSPLPAARVEVMVFVPQK